MGKTNWRAGLFRLWLAGSLLWAGMAAWTVYNQTQTISIQRHADGQKACFEYRKAKPELGNPFDCFDDGRAFDDPLTPAERIWEFARLTLPPTVGALSLGIVGFWIAAGFRRRSAGKW